VGRQLEHPRRLPAVPRPVLRGEGGNGHARREPRRRAHPLRHRHRVPGAFASGTNHFAHAGAPADADRAATYAARYGALLDELPDRLGALVPPGADAGEVATAIADVVDLPPGRRPLRTHVDPSRDGSEVVSVVADRIRAEFFRRAGLEDLLTAGASR
jgi:hypothetical protein